MHNKSLFAHSNSVPLPTVSVVGARGYSGLELTRLLLKHPAVKLTHCFATKDFSLTQSLLEKNADQIACLADDQLMHHLTDIVFLATPAEVSLKLAPKILAAGKKVVDLSGAFRLKKNKYSSWYGFEHDQSAALEQTDYGLVPFAGPAKKNLIANPGCYATAISMALIPLLKRNLLKTENIVIDAKSGTTGAGKKAAENLLFSEVAEDCLPYRIGKHQHLPEILENIENYAGVSIDPHFSTHLLPVKRGLIAGIYATAITTDLAEIEKAYTDEFANYPLVRHGREISKFASLANVTHSPYVHISYELVGPKLYLFSVIDNLLKGAASQAIENLNRLLDLPVSFSLTTSEI